MRRVPYPSPNYGPRPHGIRPTGLILHADAGSSEAGTLAWLANPASGVSYHFLVGRDGTIYDVVDSMHRAWHAGLR